MASDAEVSGQRTVSGYSGRAVKPIALRFVLELAKSELMKGMTLSGIVGTKCVGCYLCRLVCPIGAIHLSKRVKK